VAYEKKSSNNNKCQTRRNNNGSGKNNRNKNSSSFAARLFAVYQHVLAQLLREYPIQQHFVVVEDDTVLLNATRLCQELHWAVMQHNDVGYYSLRRATPTTDLVSVSSSSVQETTTSSSCVYQYSTTAHVMSRRLMEQIVHADTDSACRLPIDMFVARAGPWHVTVHPITQHVGTQRFNLFNGEK
jgi:hypothetical protein